MLSTRLQLNCIAFPDGQAGRRVGWLLALSLLSGWQSVCASFGHAAETEASIYPDCPASSFLGGSPTYTSNELREPSRKEETGLAEGVWRLPSVDEAANTATLPSLNNDTSQHVTLATNPTLGEPAYQGMGLEGPGGRMMMGGGAPGLSMRYGWLAGSGENGLGMHEAAIDFGLMIPPVVFPPLHVNGQFGTFILDSPDKLALPGELHLASLGLAMPMPISDRTTIMFQSNLRMSGEFNANNLQFIFQAMGHVRLSDRTTLMAGGGVKMLCDLSRLDADQVQPMINVMSRFQWTDDLQLLFGAAYLGSDAPWPMIPMAGLIWTPREDLRFDLVMPNPRISRRFVQSGAAEWWGYLAAGMDGESWYVERPDGMTRAVRYSHFQLALGIERKVAHRVRGRCEFGYALGRSVNIDDEDLKHDLEGTLSVSASITF